MTKLNELAYTLEHDFSDKIDYTEHYVDIAMACTERALNYIYELQDAGYTDFDDMIDFELSGNDMILNNDAMDKTLKIQREIRSAIDSLRHVSHTCSNKELEKFEDIIQF